MEFNNKTIIILGLIACGLTSLILNFENIAATVVGALGGVLVGRQLATTQNKTIEDETNEEI